MNKHSHLYRPDIDGLRAIAVLATVLFHAAPKLLPGGFAGVDIFFVISGFLISGIILRHLEQGNFSFRDFYLRRIRRIFPALCIVLIACIVGGWALLFRQEMSVLGTNIAGGAGFISNIVLWRQTGYFEAASEQNPLLHLWSLGIEEQYYLMWPFLLVFAWKRTRKIGWLFAAVGIPSFVAGVWASFHSPSAAYYFPVTRFWELMVGSALAYVTLFHGERMDDAIGAFAARLPSVLGRAMRSADCLACAGFALVAAALVMLKPGSVFPGWWALLPTVGTALTIWAGQDALPNRTLLRLRPMVLVGMISYPLYLWHWPLHSFTQLAFRGEPGLLVRCLELATGIVLSWLTYRVLEVPIRSSRNAAPIIALCGAMIVCAATGLYLAKSPQVRLARQSVILDSVGDFDYPMDSSAPVSAGKGEPEVFFYGDSHMAQYWARVDALSQKPKIKTSVFLVAGGCPPLPDVERVKVSLDCGDLYESAMKVAYRPSIHTVVFGGFWDGYFLTPYDNPADSRRSVCLRGDSTRSPIIPESRAFDKVWEDFEAEVARLVAADKTVYIILSNPTSEKFDPHYLIPSRITGKSMNSAQAISRSEFERHSGVVRRRLQAVASHTGARLIEPLDYFCREDVCATVDNSGRPIYKDADHVSSGWVRTHAEFIDSILDASPVPESGSRNN